MTEMTSKEKEQPYSVPESPYSIPNEWQKEEIAEEAKSYSPRFGNPERTANADQTVEISEVHTNNGTGLSLKIRVSGTEDSLWACDVDRIWKYEDKWLVGLRSKENSKQQTVMILADTKEHLIPIKEEDFDKMAKFLVSECKEEVWYDNKRFAIRAHRMRIREAWNINLNSDWHIPTWLSYGDFREIQKTLRNPLAEMLFSAGLLNPFNVPRWLRTK